MRIHNLDHDVSGSLAQLEGEARTRVAAVLAESDGGWLTPSEVQQLLQDTGWTMSQLMLQLNAIASLYACVPISGFHVGATALGDSGALYYGCNLEFAGQALSFCTHGEQAAITNARHHGETGVKALSVNAAPCGYCRQFLNELRVGANLQVVLATGDTTLGTLLPNAFGPGELGNTCRLLDAQDHQLSLVNPSNDLVVQRALAMANGCYAPYTQGYAGVAVQTSGGEIYGGALEENCAYNPSMSPMEGALLASVLGGNQITDVVRAVLVQCQAKSNQASATAAVLSSVAPFVTLETYGATSAEVPSCLS